MSSRAIVFGLAGVYLGIFGLILAASATEIQTQGGNPFVFASLVWAFGWIFFLAAYVETKRPQ